MGMEKEPVAFMPQALLLSGGRSVRLCHRIGGFQHGFGKDAVTPGGVIHQHMGHRSHQFAILKDGAAAHECVNIGPTSFLGDFNCFLSKEPPK